MLTKIFFTLSIVAAVMAFLRFRQQQEGDFNPARPSRVINPDDVPEKPSKFRSVGWLATIAVSLMMLSFAGLMYNSWKESNDLIYVRVVDASSGKSQQYSAYRGDIEDRSFKTINGVTVRLADTERMETSTIPPAQN